MSADPDARAQAALLLGGVLSRGAGSPELRHRRSGEAYAADSVVAGTVAAVSDAVTVRFETVASVAADFVELRIPAAPCAFQVLAMRLDAAPVGDFARRVVSAREQVETLGQQAVRVVARSRRPVLEVDLRGLSADGTLGVVEVDVVCEQPSAEVLAAVERESEALRLLVERRAESGADVAFAHGEALRRQQARLDALQQAVDDSVERLVSDMHAHASAACDAAIRDAAATEAGVAELAARSDRIADALEALRAGQAAAAEQSERLLARVEAVEWSIRNVFWRRWLNRLRGAGR